MRLETTRHFLLASAAMVAFSSPAFALDGADVLKKINAAYHVQGAEIAAKSIAVNGDTVTLTGVTLGSGADAAQQIPVGTVTLDGVEEDNGGYTIEKMAFENINYSQENVSFTVSDIYMSGVIVPADTTTGKLDSMLFYDEAHSGPVSVKIDGKETFSVEESTATMTKSEDEGTVSFDVNATGFKGDLTTIQDPKTKEAIDKLKLQSIAGELNMSGSWEIAPGTVNIDEYALDLKDVGRLNMSVSFSGYTLDFIKSMQDAVKAQAANPNKEQADQAFGLAMLGLIQQLSFNNAEISFDDASITKRAIDYAAGEQGMTGDQLAQTIKGMVPLMMAQLNVPELQNAVSAAVNTYIDDPKNFTVSAAPEKPVPFPMIMGAAMGAPNTLPKVLGVTVTANE
ncbi:membrane protein [Agrobacterium larrymoorei]|uniref:DUF945 domain-containing protein n=1 Tax=Agrobacterium larrymoorei TaxID=160699 RepID=A0A4D7DV22_9HYPH|nr:membrane protein [Agrobacterium larrymoorei]QCJ00329.1 hypothetical protein CFBP5473_20630 [Agrobacterium larrymoorei]QYA09225.1 hypothetical protein J5285_17725 [Agrobacterium larrymoorei]